MRQLSQEEAITFYEGRKWEPMSERERAAFQMYQDRLCMPFEVFHAAVEKTLGRPVFTHEFGLNREGLIAELHKDIPAPTFDQILALIPEDKRAIVVVA